VHLRGVRRRQSVAARRTQVFQTARRRRRPPHAPGSRVPRPRPRRR